MWDADFKDWWGRGETTSGVGGEERDVERVEGEEGVVSDRGRGGVLTGPLDDAESAGDWFRDDGENRTGRLGEGWGRPLGDGGGEVEEELVGGREGAGGVGVGDGVWDRSLDRICWWGDRGVVGRSSGVERDGVCRGHGGGGGGCGWRGWGWGWG